LVKCGIFFSIFEIQFISITSVYILKCKLLICYKCWSRHLKEEVYCCYCNWSYRTMVCLLVTFCALCTNGRRYRCNSFAYDSL